MLFTQKYGKSSGVRHSDGQTMIDFAPDLGREPTYFRGKIAEPLRYREAMCALRDVVVSDLTYHPKDHTAYQEWVQQQYLKDVAHLLGDLEAEKMRLGMRIQEIQERLHELYRNRHLRNKEFYKAQQRYFNYLYEIDKAAWWVLDPVITVAPDQLFFEAFSLDESAYGRLAVHQELFTDVKDFAYGTTNIDFSDALYDELQRIRTYKETEFQIDPTGFEVATEDREVYKERKIDVPTSWIRGFLQVQSAMSLPMSSFDVKPIDLYNLCRFLRQHREKKGPRDLRFVLEPGQPVRVIIQPWGEEMVFAESVYLGAEKSEIRTWGRRRLFLLERLLPLTKKVTIHLLGTGMPSFYVLDMGTLSYTLGLSGWTRNDWANAGQFDLMVGLVHEATPEESGQVFAELRVQKMASEQQLALMTGLPIQTVVAALRQLCSAGRVMFDLEQGKYRLRELTREPLPLEELQYANPREKEAEHLVTKKRAMLVDQKVTSSGETELHGQIQLENKELQPQLTLDADGRISQADCQCYFHRQNRLMQGPCEHLLALLSLYRAAERGKNY